MRGIFSLKQIKETLKSKKKVISLFFLVFLFVVVVMVGLNITAIQTYQARLRDEIRRQNLSTIKKGLETYIISTNNCPKTSNPVPHTYLPELIVEDGFLKGGVSVSSLEDVDDYFNKNMLDPKGNAYLIGINNGLIYIYTNEVEDKTQLQLNTKDEIKSIYEVINSNLCSNANYSSSIIDSF